MSDEFDPCAECEWRGHCESERDEARVDLARERAKIEQLTRERDEARFVIENMYNTIERLQHERDAAVSNLEAKDCAYRGACQEGENLERSLDAARAEVARQLDLLNKFVYEESHGEIRP